MSNDPQYRMYVELATGAKFRAQGDVAEVRIDAERFYALCNVPLVTTAKPDINGSAHIANNGHTNGNGTAAVNAADAVADVAPGLDQAMLDRLFSKDKHGTVSLRALPSGENTEADALVALIYGASKLANEQQVTGSRLMKASMQSGLSKVDRVDRFLRSQIGPYVTAAGFKKGRRYGLTNPGIRRAEEILTGILG